MKKMKKRSSSSSSRYKWAELKKPLPGLWAAYVPIHDTEYIGSRYVGMYVCIRNTYILREESSASTPGIADASTRLRADSSGIHNAWPWGPGLRCRIRAAVAVVQ